MDDTVDELRSFEPGIGKVDPWAADDGNAAHRTDWSPLTSKKVVLLPDLDAARSAHADTITSILSKLNPPASPKIVPIPRLADGNWRELGT